VTAAAVAVAAEQGSPVKAIVFILLLLVLPWAWHRLRNPGRRCPRRCDKGKLWAGDRFRDCKACDGDGTIKPK
jgi:hypothetical protein